MNSLTTLPRDVAGLIPSGEAVSWSGAPARGILFRAQDAFTIPFMLLWTGLIFAPNGTPQHPPTTTFELFKIPFVLIGLYLLVGRFVVDAALRARTTYVVTDRAAYILRSGPFAANRRFGQSALDSIQYLPHGDGSGSIRFAPVGGFAYSRYNSLQPPSQMGFERIPEAERVYRLLVDLRDAPRG